MNEHFLAYSSGSQLAREACSYRRCPEIRIPSLAGNLRLVLQNPEPISFLAVESRMIANLQVAGITAFVPHRG